MELFLVAAVVAYLVIGIAQIFAFIAGMRRYFGLCGFVSFIIFVVAYSSVPGLGALFVAVMTYYGARHDWHWAWWKSFALAAPAVVLVAILAVAVVLFSVAGQHL